MFHSRRSSFAVSFVLILSFCLFFDENCFSQDDLLKFLQSETQPANEKVIGTFKGNKIINIETNETVRRCNLDFRVSHLFGNIGKESGGGIHNLYGIDQSADIRLGFHYGLTDRLMAGISHAKRHENFEGLLKFRLLEQSVNGSMPLSVTLYGNSTYSIRESEFYTKNIYRLTYVGQAIITRKFSPGFSVAIIPGVVHRNFVSATEKNTVLSLSGGFRCKITRSTSIIADYSHAFREVLDGIDLYDAIGAGVEIETGGHVFSIMFTNASGLLENDYIVNTVDSWGKGGMKFSFIVSRMFKLGKDEKGSD